MITYVNLSFNHGKEKYAEIRRMLEQINCANELEGPEDLFPGRYCRQFAADDPMLAILRNTLHDKGFSWNEQKTYVYSLKELRAAKLLHLSPWSTGERDVGKQSKEIYDFATGCPQCHTCARQIGSLQIRKAALPRKSLICYTRDDHMLVAQPIYDALLSAGLEGLCMRQTVSCAGKALPWWQLDSDREMPPMAKQYVDRQKGGCLQCKRDNWVTKQNDGPIAICYSRKDLGTGYLPDVIYTYERFGVSAFEENQFLAKPFILVSPKFMEVLLSFRISNLRYSPVRILST